MWRFGETAKKKYCGNCNSLLNPDDKFCRVCGVAASAGNYKPSTDAVSRIYGPPPVRRIHLCSACGYQWETFLMRDNQKYCPLCGGEAPAQED